MLVTVKAYPGLSVRHGEVVCVAGIVENSERVRSWGRLWPVPFRDLDEMQQFSVWQWIDMAAVNSRQDSRSETWVPDADSITIGAKITTGAGRDWAERMAVLEPLMSASMCQVQEHQQRDGVSLGAFRPTSVVVDKPEANDEWSEVKTNLAAQPSLFNPSKQPLQWIPWRFKYGYRCGDRTDCNGHHMTVVDWGLQELFRRSARTGGEQAGKEAVCTKMEELANRDLVFMVGNQHQRPATFMLIGLAYPPLLSQGQAYQPGLDLL